MKYIFVWSTILFCNMLIVNADDKNLSVLRDVKPMRGREPYSVDFTFYQFAKEFVEEVKVTMISYREKKVPQHIKGQFDQITKISFEIRPIRKSLINAKNNNVIVKRVEASLPLNETRFLKMREIRNGDVTFASNDTHICISVAYKKGKEKMRIRYLLDEKGQFLLSLRNVVPPDGT